MKEQRLLEAEREKAMRERDADLAAKEAAFVAKKKAEEAERALQVEAAQREVAQIFRDNKERELQSRLEREAAAKARFRRIAAETREQIELANQRDKEAERQAELALQAMKRAQHESEIAKHRRNETMRELKAQADRRLQEVSRREARSSREQLEAAEARAMAEAKRQFHTERAERSPRGSTSSPTSSAVLDPVSC